MLPGECMQKKLLFILFSIFTFGLFLSFRSNSISTETRSESLKRILSDSRLEVTQENGSVLRVRDRANGNVTYKNVEEDTKPFSKSKGTDLAVDLRTLDTAQYSKRYRFWREVPVANTFKGVVTADLNRNNRSEIYSIYKDYTTESIGCVYEYQPDSSFTRVVYLPETALYAWAYGDVKKDGLIDMVYHLPGGKLIIGSQLDSLSLPIDVTAIFDTAESSGQPIRVNLYDIDSDGNLEMIYYLDGGGGIFPPSNQICKYNHINGKFEVVYYHHPNRYSAGFTFGDFDLDGKKNIANGGINGEFFMYEHQSGNNYSMQLIDTIPTNNAYLSAATNDVDGDGKSELWMGGDFFYNGVGITRLVLYETTGNDSYESKYQIDIIGVFSFFAGNLVAADLDNDGKEELVLCIDQNVLVFKNTGGNSYALWYIKKNDFALSGANSVFYEVTVTDFDNDKFSELMIGMDQVIEGRGVRIFSRIYKNTTTTSTRRENWIPPSEFIVSQNYPNPFNGQTSLRFTLPRAFDVTLSIYDISGKEIFQTTQLSVRAGQHEFRWDATDENHREVPSGVYFITVRGGGFSKTIKTLLLK